MTMPGKQLSPDHANQFRTYTLGTNQDPSDTFAIITVTGTAVAVEGGKEFWDLQALGGWSDHAGNLRLTVDSEADGDGFAAPPHTFSCENSDFVVVSDPSDWVYEVGQNRYYTFPDELSCLVVRVTGSPAEVKHIAFMRPTGTFTSVLMDSQGVGDSRKITRRVDAGFLDTFDHSTWDLKGTVRDG